jgi:hypothetical protein
MRRVAPESQLQKYQRDETSWIPPTRAAIHFKHLLYEVRANNQHPSAQTQRQNLNVKRQTPSEDGRAESYLTAQEGLQHIFGVLIPVRQQSPVSAKSGLNLHLDHHDFLGIPRTLSKCADGPQTTMTCSISFEKAISFASGNQSTGIPST